MNSWIKRCSLISLLVACAAITGCASNPSDVPGTYDDSQVMRAHTVYFGRIIRVRNVRVRRKNANNQLAGTAIGAIAGGLLGSAFGGGSGRTAATVVGAVAGGAVGHAATENSSNTYHRALEFIIRLENGRTISVIQEGSGHPDDYYSGQQVRITKINGRTEIDPL